MTMAARRIVGVVIAAAAVAFAACPTAPASGRICNGRGDCTPLGACKCDPSAFGFDCSQLRCPSGLAWSGDAVGINQIHVNAECSNRGLCNRENGECHCDVGFTGASCDKLACPNQCTNNGRCVSMSQLALLRSPNEQTYTSVWDAEMVYGCLCDRGSAGVDCEWATCPLGDDPMTLAQVNEVQLLRCTATAGSFVLKLRGESTTSLAVSTTAAQLKSALQNVAPFGTVRVTYSFGATLCDASGRNVVSVEFTSVFGPQPSMLAVTTERGQSTLTGNVVTGAGGAAIGTTVSIRGTKEYAPCSNRGYCNPKTGQCACYIYPMPGFRSSDGYGKVGHRGDCGAPDNTNFYGGAIKGCPGYIPCSGHGTCSGAPSFTCACAVGWTTGDCSMRDCPKGTSWFSLPSRTNEAHTVRTTCSDGGTCDPITGECECFPPFEGPSCNLMQCPKGDSVYECSGHGNCLSLQALAQATMTRDWTPAGFSYGLDSNSPHTWDALRIQGCQCDRGYMGHDCSLKRCPQGDDPLTLEQVNDVQAFQCAADSGSFQLSFRGESSPQIPFNANLAAVLAAVQTIPTITDIVLSFSQRGGGACVGGNVVTMTFVQDFGNLPRLQVLDQGLSLNGVTRAGQTIVTKVQNGTKENAVCSNHGVCDYSTGVCQCGFGFGSSDGYGQPGTRGDCGYLKPWQVVVS
ncbi:hypothetical protein H310_02048 [Aphanomyces invadans]|uniref:EGF-like domain-containing protein n=1 Tax=Aphanomyces invadans TaxID=157072 RepID=A0A024UM80_9STRA|nr:hypothetical protein H310_02048 [Aphanomyces invadans]ETW07561.1 hypothetical protein H310_02048 [Aphanomyces invadans]|eukprot:XP_008863654.1 hypothetical protein H310_02048 [Aphanomyces invadans]